MYAPNFSKQELTHSNFAVKNGIDNTPNESESRNLVRLSWFLQAIKIGISNELNTEVKIRVSSGFRNSVLNAKIGGSKTSFHLEGMAADITCTHLTPYQLAIWIKNNMGDYGYSELIQEYGRWVHVAIPQMTATNKEKTAVKLGTSTKYVSGINK